ncbi:uncharacterized protein LOC112671849 isoform X4 [Canis lupus dingo]|uniref:uncharacterized protein LOC112671849 isoform X2 n=1 Tax=Canis lupus dingo TaxID=286419 RepID=UPI0020C3E3E9|nr:uncharacterized protein LOC112671849 isoform X2 [Canis lupus dingo]XP_048963892.1 uncharacterized protein LOC112671849 isoform X3 [Canis lupus dingo]XP_048963893.1 uncharacterized protein LOC112671849 isoform X4 [Canis lupus dingo]
MHAHVIFHIQREKSLPACVWEAQSFTSLHELESGLVKPPHQGKRRGGGTLLDELRWNSKLIGRWPQLGRWKAALEAHWPLWEGRERERERERVRARDSWVLLPTSCPCCWILIYGKLRTMDPNETPAVPCCPSDSPTGLETGAPWGIELGPKRAVSRCVHCYNHGFTEQIKDQEHFCPFQACDCHKCAFFSEHRSVLPAESALNKEQGAHLKRHLAQGLTRSGASLPKAHGHVTKLTIQAGVISKHPRSSADWSGPKTFVSILDSSSLEDATNNFCFEEDPQDPCPAQPAPEASDQDLVSASEWQREAGSSRGSADSERLYPGVFWLHLPATALRGSSSCWRYRTPAS